MPAKTVQSGLQEIAKAGRHKPGKADKTKRREKEIQRKIVTYNLYHDPVFKLNGAIADKRHFGAPLAANRFGSGLPRPASTPALKLEEQQESAGIAFGCRDNPFPASSNAKEVTACYKHTVDKAWKTQTYVSREYNADGTQRWGGGLSVKYAY
ncbi:hypothetical protein EGT07_21535 [Herbaspirillum sp. HC18]|nr:hypothetical protein EGT07_21535 [Herbaspirillum sp. HC18]